MPSLKAPQYFAARPIAVSGTGNLYTSPALSYALVNVVALITGDTGSLKGTVLVNGVAALFYESSFDNIAGPGVVCTSPSTSKSAGTINHNFYIGPGQTLSAGHGDVNITGIEFKLW